MIKNQYTKKDNYQFLKDLVNKHITGPTNQRLTRFIDHEIELIDMRANKCRAYQQAHKVSNDELTEAILEQLAINSDEMSVLDLVSNIPESTPQKIIYRLGTLFKEGRITKTNYTTPEGNHYYYKLAREDD